MTAVGPRTLPTHLCPAALLHLCICDAIICILCCQSRRRRHLRACCSRLCGFQGLCYRSSSCKAPRAHVHAARSVVPAGVQVQGPVAGALRRANSGQLFASLLGCKSFHFPLHFPPQGGGGGGGRAPGFVRPGRQYMRAQHSSTAVHASAWREPLAPTRARHPPARPAWPPEGEACQEPRHRHVTEPQQAEGE